MVAPDAGREVGCDRSGCLVVSAALAATQLSEKGAMLPLVPDASCRFRAVAPEINHLVKGRSLQVRAITGIRI